MLLVSIVPCLILLRCDAALEWGNTLSQILVVEVLFLVAFAAVLGLPFLPVSQSCMIVHVHTCTNQDQTRGHPVCVVWILRLMNAFSRANAPPTAPVVQVNSRISFIS